MNKEIMGKLTVDNITFRIGNNEYRIDGINGNITHLERLEFAEDREIRYTEDYSEISTDELLHSLEKFTDDYREIEKQLIFAG